MRTQEADRKCSSDRLDRPQNTEDSTAHLWPTSSVLDSGEVGLWSQTATVVAADNGIGLHRRAPLGGD